MKPEKQLYQWDVNQYLTGINPAAQYVDYTIGNEVIRLETDGTRCRIPDELLQTDDEKTCYERYQDGTFRAYSFTVLYAPKPPGYAFTPEERTTFEALTARADAAIEDIKRRADSGEFTPVKGVDYFTEEDKTELMEGVSSGAVGEFRKVVDTATTEYNDNHNLKLAKYNANASEKLTTYDTNAEQHTTDYNDNHNLKLAKYNANASEKLTTYDTNAEQHTTDYNRNAEQKLEAYNQNHTEKVSEYNQNAETKTAEFEANIDGLMSEKANVDGYYEEMTVGDAEQLISTQFVEDNEPYLFRPTGGSYDVGNRAYLDKIVGGTVAWNQHLKSYTNNNASESVNGDVVTIVPNDSSNRYIAKGSSGNISVIQNHVYLQSVVIKSDGEHAVGFQNYLYLECIKKTTSATWTVLTQIAKASSSRKSIVQLFSVSSTEYQIKKDSFNLFDLTQMFGSTIADYIYSLEQSQAGAGVAWFKKLFPKDYYEYNAGELLSVGGLKSHDTVGFNQWDEEWEVGSYGSDGLPIASDDKIRTKNRIRVKPSTAYYFKNGGSGNLIIFWYDDNDTVISYESTGNSVKTSPANAKYLRFRTNNYGTTYNHDICINLSSPSRNGEYEPYEKHSYPLANSLTLRGIPKLDASNNLYYDGDEYASDGTVTRKYGIVDLGTLNWDILTYGESIVFRSYDYTGKKPSGNTFVANIICSDYESASSSDLYSLNKDKAIAVHDGNAWLMVNDSTYTNATTFKEAMQGVMLVYELATTTTETAEPYRYTQIVDDIGTEEFVSTGIVPVGHKTRYPANLRDKLQHLPDLAGMDGTYLIRQTGKQMSLVYMPAVLPETPTEDGKYTLKTVVTGGVATLQWVAK